MTKLEQYNEIMKQIRELEKIASVLKNDLENEAKEKREYKADGGLFTLTKNPKYLYFRYSDRTYYTGGPVLNFKGKVAGRQTSLQYIAWFEQTLIEKGFTKVG